MENEKNGIIELGSMLEAWIDNLFACKTAISTGEISDRTADNALTVVHLGLKYIAEELKKIENSDCH